MLFFCASLTVYTSVSVLYPFYYPRINDLECELNVATNVMLCIGLSIIWMIQLRYSLRALRGTYKSIQLTKLLSSYDGYKAFLRFLVSELSIENLEFFQLSMRWRYRICCWRYGQEHGTKEPHIKLPFQIFSFQYVDRLLPQQHGGGLVPNTNEQHHRHHHKKNSAQFFSTLPMSRQSMLHHFNRLFLSIPPNILSIGQSVIE